MNRALFLIPLLVAVGCSPKPPAAITGRVVYTGPSPIHRLISMEADAECQNLYQTGPKQDNALGVSSKGELADVFIYLKSGLEGKTFPVPDTPVTIDQKGCWFQPRVLGIQVGQTLQVTNSDPVTHNIHPQPVSNREWNASQAPADPPVTRRFSRPELIFPVKCNIHNWMRAFIAVVSHPYFAVTKSDGSFTIENIPPGTYVVAAIHPTLGEQEQSVTFQPAQKEVLALTFKGK